MLECHYFQCLCARLLLNSEHIQDFKIDIPVLIVLKE